MNEAACLQFDEGPLGAASEWVNAVMRAGSLSLAWQFTDSDMRKDLATAWVAANRDDPLLAGKDRDAIVEDLASLKPKRLLPWHAFDVSEIAFLRREFADVDIDTWCWATDPRPLGLDLEAALFIDAGPLDSAGQPLEPLAPGERPALAFVMHYVDGSWLVSAVSAPDRSPDS